MGSGSCKRKRNKTKQIYLRVRGSLIKVSTTVWRLIRQRVIKSWHNSGRSIR